jgi:hypothetical protein
MAGRYRDLRSYNRADLGASKPNPAPPLQAALETLFCFNASSELNIAFFHCD